MSSHRLVYCNLMPRSWLTALETHLKICFMQSAHAVHANNFLLDLGVKCERVFVSIRTQSRSESVYGTITSLSLVVAFTCSAPIKSAIWWRWGSRSLCAGSCGSISQVRDGKDAREKLTGLDRPGDTEQKKVTFIVLFIVTLYMCTSSICAASHFPFCRSVYINTQSGVLLHAARSSSLMESPICYTII